MKREMTPREKLFTFIATSVIVIYALSAWLIAPMVSEWESSNSALNLTRVQYLKALKTTREAKMQMVTAEQKKNTQEENTIATLLEDIEKAADRKIVIRRFQPFNSSQPVNGELRSLQVQLECSGSLNNLMEFFERMETQNRMTRIRQFYLLPESNKQGNLQCQVTVVRIVKP